jgi:hypothetical protein
MSTVASLGSGSIFEESGHAPHNVTELNHEKTHKKFGVFLSLSPKKSDGLDGSHMV